MLEVVEVVEVVVPTKLHLQEQEAMAAQDYVGCIHGRKAHEIRNC